MVEVVVIVAAAFQERGKSAIVVAVVRLGQLKHCRTRYVENCVVVEVQYGVEVAEPLPERNDPGVDVMGLKFLTKRVLLDLAAVLMNVFLK